MGETDACPACGVYMHKWQQQHGAQTEHAKSVERVEFVDDPASASDYTIEEFETGYARLLYLRDADPHTLLVRAAVIVVLALWTLRLVTYSLAEGAINQSFMHSIVLPLHEAGHMFFIPFGEFLTIAGGSLFQIALPFGIAAAFLIKNRDPFGAAICCWWAAMSLVDVAPYIYDALQPQLILLTGQTGEDGPHDWIYLFESIGGLRHAQRWGRFAHIVGTLSGVLALGWAAAVVWLAHQRANTSTPHAH